MTDTPIEELRECVARAAGCQVGSDRTRRIVDFILARDVALADRLSAQAAGGEAEQREKLIEWARNHPKRDQFRFVSEFTDALEAWEIAAPVATYDHGKRDGIEAGAEVTLAECPPGLFRFGDYLGFKSEYRTRLASHLYRSDAYCVESGEYFWGGTNGDVAARELLLVQPIDAAALSGEGREVAKGVVTVPREATDAMLEAVKPWPAHWPKEGPDFPAMNAAYLSDQWAARCMWRTMIDAALATPKPQIAPEMEPIPDSEEG